MLIVIVGFCSVEIEEQVLVIVYGLKDVGIDLFRVGIWKFRIRLGFFEGVGIEGFSWLKKVKEEMGMKVIIEVVNIQYVF